MAWLQEEEQMCVRCDNLGRWSPSRCCWEGPSPSNPNDVLIPVRTSCCSDLSYVHQTCYIDSCDQLWGLLCPVCLTSKCAARLLGRLCEDDSSDSDSDSASEENGDMIHNEDQGDMIHAEDNGDMIHTEDTGDMIHTEDMGDMIHTEDNGDMIHNEDKVDMIHAEDKGDMIHTEDTGDMIHNEVQHVGENTSYTYDTRITQPRPQARSPGPFLEPSSAKDMGDMILNEDVGDMMHNEVQPLGAHDSYTYGARVTQQRPQTRHRGPALAPRAAEDAGDMIHTEDLGDMIHNEEAAGDSDSEADSYLEQFIPPGGFGAAASMTN